jgi:hypothetical protein
VSVDGGEARIADSHLNVPASLSPDESRIRVLWHRSQIRRGHPERCAGGISGIAKHKLAATDQHRNMSLVGIENDLV